MRVDPELLADTKENPMKKLGIVAALTLLFALPLGAAGAGTADYPLSLLNNSKGAVTVTVVWSGGGLPEFKVSPGTAHGITVPGNLDSVKMTVSGMCRESVETFNPKNVDRAVLDCHGNVYRIQLEKTKPAS
jgi:hypothetical protein